MPVLIFAIIGAALLTLILSPSIRGMALRRLFYRDRPATPPGWKPKEHYYSGGVRLA